MNRTQSLLLLWAALLPTLAMAQGGGGSSTGNGGKGYNAYLTAQILKIDELLMQECQHPSRPTAPWREQACKAAGPLFDQIMAVKIMTDYIVYGKIDGKPRDAVNDLLEDGKPFVTYSIRNLVLASPSERRRVLLHEFVTRCGLESSDSYGYSTLILNFLEGIPGLEGVLSDLPVTAPVEKTFRGLEATIRRGSEVFPVLVESAEDYQRFCIAKGFSQFTSLYLWDVSYSQFVAENSSQAEVARLNDEGFVIQTLKPSSRQARVIHSITCK